MGIVGLYNKFDAFSHKIFSTRFAMKASKHYKEMYEKNGIQYRKLNHEQKKKVRKLWGTADYSTHELYYSLTGQFDEKICPELLFRTVIEPKLNDKKVTYAWDDKAFFDRYLPSVPFPKTIVRNVGGV